jgi:superfamily II DNA or RNA helicase/diadenosine tetraphosphate (Ap4A) HIT family hydrolase/HKD family nuclease/SOS-response transcriptional repressor LexA
MMVDRSPFHDVPPDEWIASNRSAFAIWDRYPVSPGHALVIPFRLVTTWWDASPEEHSDLLALSSEVKRIIDEVHGPDGYNLGFNAGEAAGQTVHHLHLHVIPRYSGDVPDPRGGVRHVIPSRGNYLEAGIDSIRGDSSVDLYDALHDETRLRTALLRSLRSPEFDRIDLLVSFIMRSGLDLIADHLDDALSRGAKVRVLTTDYLSITDPDALARLLDRQETLAIDGPSDSSTLKLDVRVWQDSGVSFHPKAYLFWSDSTDVAAGFVGSSNLSLSGISTGIEWNLGISRIEELRASFEKLWVDERAVRLDHQLLRNYRAQRREDLPHISIARSGVALEAPTQPVAPTEIQREALVALEATRTEGHASGLVVMATGLGKTWLAAFDSTRPQFKRTLFIAHREEILRQSLEVFRKVRPDAELGMFIGSTRQPDADVIFASIQTLNNHLGTFDTGEFDYVVVDEFHHAAASTYRTAINHFEPKFLLGLTATPERMDGADLLALCGDNLVFECSLVEGIRRGELATFSYQGLKDLTDFEPIPWRNGRFEPEALTRAVETRERANQTLDAWREFGGGPTLAFCCSISHANFMAQHFRSHGVTAVAVHSGADSSPRRDSVRQLSAGEVDIIFTIDIFNEGVDIPEIETVMMLRPTESPVIFLQQIGRGLRKTGVEKSHLRVVDFIGNHRSFLAKPRVLLSLGGALVSSDTEAVDAARHGDFNLPPGCTVAYDLEAVDLLAAMIRTSHGDTLADYCRSYTEDLGLRPSAVQAFRAGLNPRSARSRHGSWFELLDHLDLLSKSERALITSHAALLRSVEKMAITKSLKLVTLRAMIQRGTLFDGDDVDALAFTSRQIVCADPRLVDDVRNEELTDPCSAADDLWLAHWERFPVHHLTTGDAPLFTVSEGRLSPTFEVPEELRHAAAALIAELVEWRLAEYLSRRSKPSTTAIRCKVSHSSGNPIVFIDRERHPEIPDGPTSFTANGEHFDGNFVKVALNVATRNSEKGNALHDLLRGWFGPSAGLPGTNHQVTLAFEDGQWVMRPVRLPSLSEGDVIPLFQSYSVACGVLDAPQDIASASTFTVLATADTALDPTRHFIAFADGESMNGGVTPIQTGDPLLFRWARDASRSDFVGERVLVQALIDGQPAGLLKRLTRDGATWALQSDAAGYAPIPATSNMRIVGILDQVLDQAQVNPLSTFIDQDFTRQQVAALFNDDFNFGKWGQSGHVTHGNHEVFFVTLEKQGMATGTEYHDVFTSADRFHWTSQNTTGPDTPKGRKVLASPGNGHLVHLFCRRKNKGSAGSLPFTYCGIIVPLSHAEGKPMSVDFRLLTPLEGHARSLLNEPQGT